MPIANLKISKDLSAEQLQSVSTVLTNITAKYLRKDSAVTAITCQVIDQSHWFINSKSLERVNQHSFYLDIKITDGTSLKEEKSDYVKAIFAYMQTILEDIHASSYVYIEEVKADAYGFGGLTQEHRYITAKIEYNS